MVDLALRLLAGLVLIGANAFFVAVEFALTRLRGLDLEPDERASGGLRTAWELTEELEIHLTGCQLGISSTSVLLGVIVEPAFTELLEPLVSRIGVEGTSVRAISVIVAVVLLNLVHKIWGEQAPTYLGVERPREVARRLAPALALWTRVMKPIIYLGDGAAKATLRLFGVTVTRSWLKSGASDEEASAGSSGPPVGSRTELTRRMSELLIGEDLPRDRREEVLQALQIDEIASRDIMIPLNEIAWVRLGDRMPDHVRTIRSCGFVRYPVLRPDAGLSRVRRADVAGVLYVPSLFTSEWPPGPDLDLGPLLAPAVHVPPGLSVADLIDRLQDEGQELAMLTDSERGDLVVGMVTVSDAFEAIAGDLEDPLDLERA